jgi:hypothetical protein
MTFGRRRAAVMTACLILTLLHSGRGWSDTITVRDPRPVAKVVEALEQKYGWPITYEDPPYVHPSDIVDVTRSVRRSPSRAPGGLLMPGHRVLIPKGGSLSITTSSGDQAESAAAVRDYVEAAVNAYNASRGGEVFAVTQGDQLIHVLPRKVTGPSGTLEPVTPILDTAITIAPRERTAFALLEEICTAIAAGTTHEVVIGITPVNLLMNSRVSIVASNKAARSVLEELIQTLDAPLSWKVFYDPGLKWYVVNINVVPATRR